MRDKPVEPPAPIGGSPADSLDKAVLGIEIEEDDLVIAPLDGVVDSVRLDGIEVMVIEADPSAHGVEVEDILGANG